MATQIKPKLTPKQQEVVNLMASRAGNRLRFSFGNGRHGAYVYFLVTSKVKVASNVPRQLAAKRVVAVVGRSDERYVDYHLTALGRSLAQKDPAP